MFRLKANERKWSLTNQRLTGLQFEVREAI
jgi:hypothetical protein